MYLFASNPATAAPKIKGKAKQTTANQKKRLDSNPDKVQMYTFPKFDQC